MSIEKAKAYLKEKGLLEHVIELEASTATVEEAAMALGVAPGMIAKTMSFLQGEQPVLILTEGTAKVENRKYKDTFHTKAKMIPFDQVEQWIGHAPGAGWMSAGPRRNRRRMRRNRENPGRRQRPLPGIMRIAPLRGEKMYKKAANP